MLRDGRPSGTLAPELVGRVLSAVTSDLVPGNPAALGIDVVDAVEFAHNLDLGGERFASRIFTEAEIVFCAGRAELLATRFAAKEAVAKVLGTGFRGVRASEIEIRTSPEGIPSVRLSGGAATAAESAGLDTILVSMSREGACAAAVAVGVRAAH